MKKLFAIVALVGAFTFGATSSLLAQGAETATTEQVSDDAPATDSLESEAPAVDEPAPADAPTQEAAIQEEPKENFHKTLKTKFIEGDASFMSLVAIALVAGLAFCIERIVYLTLAKINTRKFLGEIDSLVASGDLSGALAFASKTRGPVAQLARKAMECMNSAEQNDIATIERTINTEAEVQGSYLEQNCSWITFCIATAPSLGFLGTVIGMVMAFDDIEKAGDISPTVVAGGMKVALITTIFGIIVAIVLQLFYNFILGRIEALTADMENSAQSLLTTCVKSPKCRK